MDTSFSEYSDFSSFLSTVAVADRMSFTALHVNIRGIRKYWNQFKITTLSVSTAVDAFILTEINISDAQKDQFSLPGFNNFFFTRECGRGGGVAVFLKQAWSAVPMNISFAYAESVVLNIDHAGCSITLLSIYRPPSNNISLFMNELQVVLSGLDPLCQICTIGDFNINILDSSKSFVVDYLNLLAQFGIDCGVQSATREEFMGYRLVSSCIDHVNTRVRDAAVTSMVITRKLADHYFTACKITPSLHQTCALSKPQQISIVDKNKLDDLIASVDWSASQFSGDTSNIYTCFVKTIASLKDRSKCFVPARVMKCSPASRYSRSTCWRR